MSLLSTSRVGAQIKLDRWAEAVVDFTAVMDDRRAPEATRLSARLRRGVAYEKLGKRALARADYVAARDDPRASEGTRRTAQHNLDSLEGGTTLG